MLRLLLLAMPTASGLTAANSAVVKVAIAFAESLENWVAVNSLICAALSASAWAEESAEKTSGLMTEICPLRSALTAAVERNCICSSIADRSLALRPLAWLAPMAAI